VARSRTFKPIPNKEIQAALGRPEYNGLDGEIIVGDPTAEGCMQATTSFVMAPNKTEEH
jgi:DNA ligase-1